MLPRASSSCNSTMMSMLLTGATPASSHTSPQRPKPTCPHKSIAGVHCALRAVHGALATVHRVSENNNDHMTMETHA
eukprot:7190635-Lingulodinium_polyedra.AAC.1